MRNALGSYRTILLLGGSSEIGRAIVARVATDATTRVVLAGRDVDALDPDAFAMPGRTVTTHAFDATDTSRHQDVIDAVVAEVGDIDLVVVAFGQLGPENIADDPAAAAELVNVNFAGAASVLLATAARMRTQGHGTIVVLSSVAGERVRKSNFVYGATKAGLDGFAQGLGDDLAGSGVQMLVVRPGFVHTKMTAGLKPAPLATTPESVADTVAAALAKGRRTAWAPAALRPLLSVFRHLPQPIWRRLPF